MPQYVTDAERADFIKNGYVTWPQLERMNDTIAALLESLIDAHDAIQAEYGDCRKDGCGFCHTITEVQTGKPGYFRKAGS